MDDTPSDTGQRPCDVEFGGRRVDEPCDVCEHALIVHPMTDHVCSICEAVAAIGVAQASGLEHELLRRVVVDYAERCCDELDACGCSMAQAARAVRSTTPDSNRAP